MATRNISFHATSKSRGMATMDLMIYTALAIAGMAAVFFVAGVVMNRQAVTEEVNTLQTMAAGTQTKFRAQGNFTGVTPNVLIQNGIVPARKVSETNIQTRWNTNVLVAPANLNGTLGDSVTFTYTVPRENCSNFVEAAEGTFPRIAVDGVNVKNVPGGANTLDVVALGAQCNAGAGGNANVVFFMGR